MQITKESTESIINPQVWKQVSYLLGVFLLSSLFFSKVAYEIFMHTFHKKQIRY
jgi:hypothetical protein